MPYLHQPQRARLENERSDQQESSGPPLASPTGREGRKAPPDDRSPAGPVSLVPDDRGAVFAEYVVVLLMASLVVALSVGALGLPLFDLYLYSEMLIGLPIP